VTAARDLTGTVVVGRYRILAPVSSDSSGEVYEAESLEGTAVALKVLTSDLQDPDVATRFGHPHIAELIEVGRLDDGACFVVTELVRGVSLRTTIEVGRVDPRRALLIARQTVEALGHAHAMGVIHRNLRPETIMLTGGDFVKVLDFGVSGTDPHYLAPEQAADKNVDGRADFYACGAILFELLTGQPPFADDEPTVLTRLHAYAPVQTLRLRSPDVKATPQLELVVSEALAKSPDARFRTAEEMLGAIDAALQSLQTVESVVTVVERPPSTTDESFLALTHEYREALKPRAPSAQATEVAPSLLEREGLGGRLARSARTLFARARAHKMAVAAAGATLLIVVLVVIILTRGSSSKSVASSDLAKRADDLVHAGQARQAVELLEVELGAGKADDGAAYLVLGHARFALNRRLDGLSAYERAIRLSPELGKDAQLHANLTTVFDSKDVAATMVALELATQVSPPDLDSIVTRASVDKTADIRHRAFSLAEREGAGDRVDRISSWSLDLAQATACEDRRAIIAKLRATKDKRAVAPIKHAQAFKCNERDAADAIAALEATDSKAPGPGSGR
jgi:serine/threonine-protein kinase